ncbi:MAG: hypothetical protein IGS48_12585 [Oscillatoriales cyanobacterium C42_A2020_001]|nr:hypothetical protein [Leptolyngbyaceae cyanobacterium C42_A2020_001]
MVHRAIFEFKAATIAFWTVIILKVGAIAFAAENFGANLGVFIQKLNITVNKPRTYAVESFSPPKFGGNKIEVPQNWGI